MQIYNCRKITLTAPKNFIPYNSIEKFKEQIIVDGCLADEIKDLWDNGVVTRGCCCGHGRNLGWLTVDDNSIPLMESLGYEHYIYEEEFGGVERKDGFIPKSYRHFYDGYSNGYRGENMKNILKPCPFCGTEATTRISVLRDDSSFKDDCIDFSISCPSCHIRRGIIINQDTSFEVVREALDKVTEVWNGRYK